MNVARGGGINWTWYLWYTVQDDGNVYIHRHDRLHNTDTRQGAMSHPTTTTGFSLIETKDGERTVTHALIGNASYTVANPGWVFGYKENVS
jgi:hypothetical protein